MNFLILVLASLLSLIILSFFMKNYKNYFISLPVKRSSHKLPTTTSGGISFVISSTFFSIFFGNFVPLISLPLAIVGIIDDKKGVRSIIRYIVQLLTVISILAYSDLINLNDLKGLFTTIFLIFLGTALINLVNFMDGLDGLISLSSLIFFLILSIAIAQEYLIIFFAILPFLFYNWSPAKMFMGDTGSTFIGALIFGAILNSGNFTNSLYLMIVLSPLLLDSSICIFRRLLAKENIFSSHKLHLYQRLNQGGLSHSKVSIIYSFYILLIGIFFAFKNILFLKISFLFIFILAIYLETKCAVSFKKSLMLSKSK